jgi:site-specific DNA-cytosine methylase
MGMLTHYTDGKPTINLIREMFEKCAGYHTEWNVLSSIEWNLPQKRRRFVIVGSRDGQTGLIPRPPFDKPTCKFGDIMQHGRTDLAWKGPTYRTALEKVKRTGVEIKVVDEDGLLPTVTCGWGGGATRKKVAIVDKTEDGVSFLRHPSVQEGGKAQGFPTGWWYPDSDTNAWTLVGNAVPPPMSKSIIEHLAKVEAGEKPPFKNTIPKFVSKHAREYGEDRPREFALEE